MKEFMPDTHVKTEAAFVIRAYAAKALSFNDIAEDRGPRHATTVDAINSEQTNEIIRKRNRENRGPR